MRKLLTIVFASVCSAVFADRLATQDWVLRTVTNAVINEATVRANEDVRVAKEAHDELTNRLDSASFHAGLGATATGNGAVAVGQDAKAEGKQAVQLGAGTNTTDNSLKFQSVNVVSNGYVQTKLQEAVKTRTAVGAIPSGYDLPAGTDLLVLFRKMMCPWWVTFDSVGGTAFESQQIIDGECAVNPGTPVKTGYTFVNWALSDGTVWDWSTEIKKDWDLQAVWSENQYQIKFDAVWGSGTYVAFKDLRYTESYAIQANNLYRPGYTASGWNTNASGTGTTYSDGQVVSKLVSTNGGVFQLYARFLPDYQVYIGAKDSEPTTTIDLTPSGSIVRRNDLTGAYVTTDGITTSEEGQYCIIAVSYPTGEPDLSVSSFQLVGTPFEIENRTVKTVEDLGKKWTIIYPNTKQVFTTPKQFKIKF